MPGGLPSVEQVFTADSSGYSAAIARMIRDNEALVKSVGDAQRQIKQLGVDLGALGDRRVRVEVTGVGEAIAEVGKLKDALDSLGDRHVHVGGDNGEMVRELRDISASMDMLTSSAGRMEQHLGIINRNAADSSASLDQMTQMLRDNADAHNAAAAAVAAHAAANRNAGGGWAAAAAGAAAAGAGGGGGGLWAAAAAAGAGGGGGGGGGFMTAAQYADRMMPFIKRWAGIAHYAIMGVNEALATIVPATMAAGAATLVGWQGVEQMIPRVKAINATAEALGGAYGITSGSYLGTGSAIQKYQNLATGGVYEIGGAAINLMKGGQGTVGQVGLSTIAMIDRGIANMQLNMAQRGTMGTLGDILGQGTGYLQQFGGLGANIGNIFLGLAPHLPGVGGDYLSALQGITGGLAGGIGFMNQHGMGNVLGAGLAAEAGWRVGTPMLGLLGRGVGNLGGLAERLGLGSRALSASAIAELAASSGVDAGLIDAGGSGLAGLLGGAGAGIGALVGPEVAGLALSAFLGSKLVGSMPTGAMRRVAGLQAGIGQAGFSAALTPLAQAIVTTQGLASKAPAGGLAALQQVETPYEIGRFGPGITPTYRDTYNAAATGFAQTTADLVNAGPQLVAALKKAGLKGVSMADAFQIAQNALLDTTHAFGKDGKLNQTALQMLMNYGAAIKPMTQTAGAFNAAIAAQQVMGSQKMKDLAGVNQSLDQMTQIMTGGPAGAATLFGMLGGTPVTHTRAGLKIAAGPAYGAMASALGSFTTAAGAGAWNTFAGQQGLIAAEQQNLDQLRTYMTLGALTSGQAGGMAGFQLQQLLPMARKSPAALAMLMQQGAQMGIGGYYDPSKSQAQNYAAMEKSIAGIANSSAQFNKNMNHAVVASSNLPATAAKFAQSVGADLQSKIAAAASGDVFKLKSTLGHAGSAGLISDLVSQFKTAGFQAGPALMSGINATLKGAGFSAAQIKAIDLKVKADTGQAQSQINSVHGKNVNVNVMSRGAQAAQAAIDAIKGKTVTVTVVVRTINEMLNIAGGAVSAGFQGGIGSLPGSPLRIHGQTGMKVPGYGGGDIVPAMLEPGELVVPKHQVAGGLVDHLRGSIPGFAGGGFVGQQAYGPSAYWGAGSQMALWNPALLAQLLAAMRASQGAGIFDHPQGFRGLLPLPGLGGLGGGNVTVHPSSPLHHAAGRFAVEILKGMQDGLKNAGPEARKLAAALVAKLQQEIGYAKGAAQAAMYGQGYDPTGRGAGIFGSMNLSGSAGLTQAQLHSSPTGNIKDYNAYVAAYAAGDPGQGPQSVQDQMKSYLGTLKSFGSDMGRLRKGHLNKDVLAQLMAAGPVQGDALAQSILGGQGGIAAVNKLWGEIGKASKGLGAQAAMAQYGGYLSPNLRDATIVGKGGVAVNISVNAGKGGDLTLTREQIAAIVAQVQAALLRQAKKNNKTGVKLPGKGS